MAATRWDHKHRLRTIQPYEYNDAAALLEQRAKKWIPVFRKKRCENKGN
jgi:hypothetical protein